MTNDQLAEIYDGNIDHLRSGRAVLHGDRLYTSEEEYCRDMRQAAEVNSSTAELNQSSSFADQSQNPKGTNSYESSTPVLSPGSARFVSDGPDYNGDGTGNPHWTVPGDFKIYLEPGDEGSRSAGLVRGILVGGYRHPADDDNDDPAYLGTFLDNRAFESVVGTLRNRVFELEQQIGFLAGTEQPQDKKPRSESWLAERAAADAKLAAADGELSRLKDESAKLRETIEQLEAENAELRASVATLTPDSASVPAPNAAKGSDVETQPPAAESLGAPRSVGESAAISTPTAAPKKGK